MLSHAEIKDIWGIGSPYNLGALLGKRSGNTIAFDFDSHLFHATWQGDYTPAQTLTGLSRRGPRPIYRTDPDAIISAKMSKGIGEILGNDHQIVMAPSKLDGFTYSDNGLSVAYITPDDPAFLALIAQIKKVEQIITEVTERRENKKITRFAQAALEGRIALHKRYSTRSEVDAALISSLFKSGYDTDEIYDLMTNKCTPSHWHEMKRESDRRAEIDRIIRKIGSIDSPQWQEAMRRADALRDYRTSHIWKGTFFVPGDRKINTQTGEITYPLVKVTAKSVEAVLLAHEMKVRDCGDYEYHLDVRSGDGRFGNLSRKLFAKANRFVVRNGIITLSERFKGTCANRYELLKSDSLNSFMVQIVEKREEKDPTSSQCGMAASPHCDEVGLKPSFFLDLFQSGYFERGALGATAGLIYRECLDLPMTSKELSKVLGLHIKTVQDGLKKLKRTGVVTKSGKRYQSDPNVDWKSLGDMTNTTRHVDKRLAIHSKDRERRQEKYQEMLDANKFQREQFKAATVSESSDDPWINHHEGIKHE